MGSSIERFREEIEKVSSKERKMVVFLCGPSLKDMTKPGAGLRKKFEEELIANDFEVVLGEDDGLEKLRQQLGSYAHEHELSFIKSQTNVIVIIASSPGAYCELGLFAYHHPRIQKKIDFVLIISDEHKDKVSFINEGPAAAVEHHGTVWYCDLNSLEIVPKLLKRLKGIRTILNNK